MYISRYHNLIQLALLFVLICDVYTTEHLTTNTQQDNYPTFYIRLARSPGDQPEAEIISQEGEKTTINEESNTNHNNTDQDTNSNPNIAEDTDSTNSKEDKQSAVSDTQEGRSSRKNSDKDKDKEDPPPAMAFPPGVQTLVASQNGKATLFLGMFQVIMMPMPSGPGAGIPAVPGQSGG